MTERRSRLAHREGSADRAILAWRAATPLIVFPNPPRDHS